jgi:hypothetical protein
MSEFDLNEVYLGCKECWDLSEYDIGTSDLLELPQDALEAKPIHEGELFNWVFDHHRILGGNHNFFAAFNNKDEQIGFVGFGTNVGYVFSKKID